MILLVRTSTVWHSCVWRRLFENFAWGSEHFIEDRAGHSLQTEGDDAFRIVVHVDSRNDRSARVAAIEVVWTRRMAEEEELEWERLLHQFYFVCPNSGMKSESGSLLHQFYFVCPTSGMKSEWIRFHSNSFTWCTIVEFAYEIGFRTVSNKRALTALEGCNKASNEKYAQDWNIVYPTRYLRSI